MVQKVTGKYAYLLLGNVIMALFMNVAVIMGTGMITGLIDEFVLNGQVDFSKVLTPTIFCMAVGTVAAYLKKCLAGLYSVKVVKELNNCAIFKLLKSDARFMREKAQGKLLPN